MVALLFMVSFKAIPSTYNVPVIFASPSTLSKFCGVAVPIPTCPVLSIVILSAAVSPTWNLRELSI